MRKIWAECGRKARGGIKGTGGKGQKGDRTAGEAMTYGRIERTRKGRSGHAGGKFSPPAEFQRRLEVARVRLEFDALGVNPRSCWLRACAKMARTLYQRQVVAVGRAFDPNRTQQEMRRAERAGQRQAREQKRGNVTRQSHREAMQFASPVRIPFPASYAHAGLRILSSATNALVL
ncbi:hypothetical protein K438DRAFT_1939781 [Mycena galopus ATCC 62051]|nr:hypothetical protein K438DRAFT_1939781 [Mycena galopus ATCC 62051]